MNPIPNTTGVILAGGRGCRMGGADKGLLGLGPEPLIQHVISAIEPQVEHLVINANRNLDEYAAFGYPLISDGLAGFQGPLAGFLAAMQYITTTNMITVPCDGPLLPQDLVQRLASAREQAGAEIAVAHDGLRLQPIHALIPTHLQPSLVRYLESGKRKIDHWYAQHKVTRVDFSDVAELFININTPRERECIQERSGAG